MKERRNEGDEEGGRKEGRKGSKQESKEGGGMKEGREGERDRGRYGRRKEQLQKKEVRT